MTSRKMSLMFFDNIDIWLNSNLLSVNFDKAKYIAKKKKISSPIDIKIGCNNREIKNSSQKKFVDFIIASSLAWKSYLDHLMNKPSVACYAVREVKLYMAQGSLSEMHFSEFHSIVSYRCNILGELLNLE